MKKAHVDILGDVEKSIHEFLEKANKSLGDDSIKTVVEFGEIAATILSIAKDMNADIIVIGSHSRNWLENIVLGSQAQEVLKKTTLPLLIIPTKKQN